jgi:hypothetical protein
MLVEVECIALLPPSFFQLSLDCRNHDYYAVRLLHKVLAQSARSKTMATIYASTFSSVLTYTFIWIYLHYI